MSSKPSQWHSINTRVTLSVLAIFVAGIWSLAFYADRLLQGGVERVSGEQQFSTVSFVAADINAELVDRLNALELIAKEIDAHLIGKPAELLVQIKRRPLLPIMFNGGTWISGMDGIVIAANLPALIGANYADREYMTAVLDGKPTISKPITGKILKDTIFIMAVPILDSRGKVIGALAGVTDLGKPNFLDKIAAARYGKSGSYLLNAPQYHLIVTSSDKSRIMQPLPPPGVNKILDRYIAGFEGYGISVNSRGVEELTAAKGIPAAGWFLGIVIPTEEAFSPIHDMQQSLLLATLFVTLMAGALTWWMLRRQLSPMLATTKALSILSATNQHPQPLPIISQDEIGDMIGGFNRLLETLGKQQKALSESEYRSRAIVEASPVPMAINDERGGITHLNRAFVETFGYTQKDISALTDWWPLAYPDPIYRQSVADRWQNNLEEAKRTGNPFVPMELNIRCKDDSVRVILGSAAALEQQFAGSHLVILYDITEHKQAAEKIIALSRDFVAFLEYTSDFIYFKDHNSCFRFCSQTLANITGHASWRDMVGKHDRDVFPKDTAQIYYEEELPIFRDGKPLLNKIDPYYDASGNPGWVSTNKWPLFGDDGTVIGLFGISSDITERKQVEAELEKHRHHLEKLVDERTAALSVAKEAAETANRAKTIFLANMSHELRTPMNGIMGMTSLAIRRATDPKQKDQLAKVEQATQRLVGIINDILDISKIEAERLTLEQKDFELSEIVENLTSLTSVSANAKGLTLDIDIAPDIAKMQLQGDPLRLGQILLNLTSNAIKFTTEGSVTLRAAVAEDTPSDVLLRFEVRDTGIGISAEDQKRVFNPFEQADGSTTRKYGGSGLGLAISKRLAQAMGGDIVVESHTGVGSTFWATVRLKKGTGIVVRQPATHVDAEALIQQRWQGNRILVVDDEPVNREVAKMLLEDSGLLVDVAEDGVEAVTLAQCNVYAAVFMDMQMPNLTGVEATQQIRDIPGYRDIPIIAMTANAFAEDKAQCIEAGMTDFLSKPFSPDELFAILLLALSRGEV